MAGIVHVNMGHCAYYHITLRKAPTKRVFSRRVLLINTGNYKTGWASPPPSWTDPPLASHASLSLPLALSLDENGNSIIYSTRSGFPLAISLTGVSLFERSFFYFLPCPRQSLSFSALKPRIAIFNSVSGLIIRNNAR